jgi:hypothetical protein
VYLFEPILSILSSVYPSLSFAIINRADLLPTSKNFSWMLPLFGSITRWCYYRFGMGFISRWYANNKILEGKDTIFKKLNTDAYLAKPKEMVD